MVAPVRRSDALGSRFAASDSGAAYYARFETHDRYADWFGWVGTALVLSGFVGGSCRWRRDILSDRIYSTGQGSP